MILYFLEQFVKNLMYSRFRLHVDIFSISANYNKTITGRNSHGYILGFCYISIRFLSLKGRKHTLKKRLSFLTDRSSINNRSFINEIITVIF